MTSLHISSLDDLPMVAAGDDLAALIIAAVDRQALGFEAGDVVVVAQKIVSKAEGRLFALDSVEPGEAAERLAQETEKDPRLVQLILDESSCVLRHKPGVIIVRHRLGHVGANAGIDQSNIDHGDAECALLLPVDPDASAARLSTSLSKHAGCAVAVVIADSHNRPWRLGTVGAAIGCAGLMVLDDRRGECDIHGRELKVTLINRADAIAAAANLVMGETTERVPAALVRGFPPDAAGSHGQAADIMRPLEDDLFQ